MKVLLEVPLSPYSGYGNDGIGLARAMVRAGADVYLQPTGVQAPLPPDVAHLLTKTLKAPFDLTISHVDPGVLRSSEVTKQHSGLYVGWTMWEYTDLHNLRGYSKLRKAYKNFSALIGYDPVSTAALQEFYSGPVLTVQGGFEPESWPEVQRNWDEENFYFCMLGVLSERKDPWVAIQAFQELKSEHPDFDTYARLSLKTTVPGLHSKMEQWMPGLRIYYDIWDDKTVRQFYKENHVLLAPSRGEGKNMPALEFQSTGGTVIATNWGGHTQWLNPAYNYPLNFTLAPVEEGKGTLNARADVTHLKELMLHVFRNRAEAKEKGALAAQIIPQIASWDAVVARLFLKLRAVEGGERLYTLSQIAAKEQTDGDN